MKAGVTQGSVCAPLLYIIYTSRLGDCLKNSTCHFYADDSQIYSAFSLTDKVNASNRLNLDLEAIVKASTDHCLTINPIKSAVMLLGSGALLNQVGEFSVKIDGVVLPVVESAKSLGVMIDSKLKFQSHISKKIQMGFGNLKKLYSIKQYLNTGSRKILCETLVLSHFNYCVCVYGPCLNSVSIARIQRLQNACLRLMYGIRKYDSITHKLVDARWLSMANRRRLRQLTMFYKIIKYEKPGYLHKKITYRTDIHHLGLRHRGKIQIPRHFTSTFKKSSSYCIANVWNSLPLDLTALELRQFRREAVRYLLGEG